MYNCSTVQPPCTEWRLAREFPVSTHASSAGCDETGLHHRFYIPLPGIGNGSRAPIRFNTRARGQSALMLFLPDECHFEGSE